MASNITSLANNRLFRFLILHGSSDPQRRLRCDLAEASLDDANLQYEAVSYCWADQSPTQAVHLEDREVLVTKNCEAALRRFRPLKNDESRNLWIDSLCINQKDTLERSYQVSLMRDIYSQAEQVLIWLRNDSEPPQGSLIHIREYSTACFDWMVKVAAAAEVQIPKSRTQCLLTLMLETNNLDLFYFLELTPWFKRLWVVQEAALGKKAFLYYDDARASLDSLFRAKNQVDEMEVEGMLSNVAMKSPLWSAFAVHDMAKKCLAWRNSPYTVDEDTLCAFLSEMRFSKTSEAKDKIYALYGLLQASNVQLSPPDYSRSTADIYRDATIAVIRSTKSIKVLENVDGLVSTEDLVSWVPDWASSKHSIGMLGHFTAFLIKPPAWFDIRNKGRYLIVKGYTVDIISSRSQLAICHSNEQIGKRQDYLSWSKNQQPSESSWKEILTASPQYSSEILFLWNLRVLRAFIEFGLGSNPTVASEESILDLYRVLMSHWTRPEDCVKDQARARSWFLTLCGLSRVDPITDIPGSDKPWMPNIHDTINHTPNLKPLIQTMEYQVYMDISKNTVFQSFHERISRIRYKTLFRAASGQLGLSPHSIRTGDEIILIAGIKVPMVVRQDGKFHRLIAQAHEGGIGDDATWRHWPGKDLAFDEITLV